jgi:transcriptional regulator with XRE-family HTH domain
MSVISSEFRKLVREGLDRTGLTARQAALQAEISPSYLSRVLAGERDYPSDDAILRLARVLEIDPPELLLAEAGRVRPRASRELGPEDMEKVMQTIRAVMAGERRSIPKRSRTGPRKKK